MKINKKLTLIGGLAAIVLGATGCHSSGSIQQIDKTAKSISQIDETKFNFDNVKVETTYKPTRYAYIMEYNQDSGAASYMQEVHRLENLGIAVLPMFSGFSSEGYEITVPEGYNLPKIAQDLSDLTYTKVSWKKLYDENKDRIGTNPDSVKAGTKLKFETYHSTVNMT